MRCCPRTSACAAIRRRRSRGATPTGTRASCATSSRARRGRRGGPQDGRPRRGGGDRPRLRRGEALAPHRGDHRAGMTFLADILARKRDEVATARRAVPEADLRDRARDRSPPRAFEAALSLPGGPARIVAEVKRASPSAGAIRAGLDAPAQARAYAAAGAAAISVLTDGPGFGGSLADLAAVREAVDVP